ncbi:MAG TPA: carboxylating nicotinate-nucleotide diphosphorylase [Candidatus Omnitrophota bacterium]|nr:carboxylating nicotinate-nucleotide diphosphorylase [Candidatus Omnitrophota bacterium]
MFSGIVKEALKEDCAKKDTTTDIIIPEEKKVKASIIVKQKAVVCGIFLVRDVFRTIDKNIKFKSYVKDGDLVKNNSQIISLSGKARSILKTERTALNFLGHLSGVATETRKFVSVVKSYKAKIYDTRKTLPGMRILEKYAVRCGGGCNHRKGLRDMVLIKDNHLSVLKGLRLRDVVKIAKTKRPKKAKIEIEVKNIKEYRDAALACPDIILLDNMTPSEVKRIVKIRKSLNFHHQLEVSGNIDLKNVRSYAAVGVERISVGALTHSASSVDFSLKII